MSTQREDWARHFMWVRLGSKERQTAEANGNCRNYQPIECDYNLADKKMGYTVTDTLQTLQCLKAQTFVSPLKAIPMYSLDKPKQESEMQLTKEQETRDHLISRLSSTAYDKKTKLADHFHTYGQTPRSKQEAEKWLKEGNFYFNKGYKYDEDDCCDSDLIGQESYEGWSWGKKSDRKDYEKAKEALQAEKLKVEDIIHVKSADEGLAALQAFEAKTFH